MRKFIWVVIVMCVTVFSAVAQTESALSRIIENGELRVGTTGNQPPYTMMSKSGELMGYEIDLATTLAEAMKVELKLVQLPFGDLLPSLEKGDIDIIMSGMTITPERNMKALFVGPYMVTGKSILVKSENLVELDEQVKINKAGISVVALKGSTSEMFVEATMPEVKLILVSSYDEAVDMVINDKAALMVADYEVCSVSILRNSDVALSTLEYPMTIEPIGMAIQANDFLLENVIRNYFKSLEMVGLLARLEMIWFDDGSWLLDMK